VRLTVSKGSLFIVGAVLATFRLATAAPVAIHIHSERAMFQVLVGPAGSATTTSCCSRWPVMAACCAKEAILALSLPPERGIEQLKRKARLGADGYWSVRDVPIPAAGCWHVSVDPLVTDFEEIAREDDFDVPAR
jgi:copper transport protein